MTSDPSSDSPARSSVRVDATPQFAVGDPSGPTIEAMRAGPRLVRTANAITAAALASFALPFPLAWVIRLLTGSSALHAAMSGTAGAVLLFIVAPLLFLGGWWLRRHGFGSPAKVSVDGRDLVIVRDGRERRICASDIVGCTDLPRMDGSRLELSLRDGSTYDIDVPHYQSDDIDRLLEMLRLTPDLRRMRTRSAGATSPLYRVLGTMLYLLLMSRLVYPVAGSSGDLPGLLLGPFTRGPAMLVLALVAWAAALWLHGPDIVVGGDGVAINWMFRRTFIPRNRIAAVREAGGSVVIDLVDGRETNIGSTDAANNYALVQRIRWVLAAPGSPAATAQAEALERIASGDVADEHVQAATETMGRG